MDYAGGKQDWFAADLPAEGARPAEDRVRHHARAVPGCAPSAPIGEVDRELEAVRAPFAVVLDGRGVVLGRIRRRRAAEESRRDPSRPADEVMKEGPSTYRPNVPVAELLEELRGKDLDDAIITTGDGVFVGVVDRSTLEHVQGAPDDAAGSGS